MLSAICFNLDQCKILSSGNGLKVKSSMRLTLLFGLGIWSRNKTVHLSHNNPCFQCKIAITKCLVSNMCEIRFHDVIGQSTVPMYSSAKILKHG